MVDVKWVNEHVKNCSNFILSQKMHMASFLAFQMDTYLKKENVRVPVVAQQVTNLTSIHEDVSLIPGLTQWVKRSGIAMSCGVGCRCSSDLA